MVKKRTHTLGIIVSDNANPFFASVVRGIEDVVRQQGYAVILCNADEDPAKEDLYLKVLREKQVDGLLLAPSAGIRTSLRKWKRSGIPLVLIDRRLKDIRADIALVDNREGARSAVAHLIALGHRRIGIISGPAQVFTGQERLAGYYEALRAAGIRPDPHLVREGDFRQASGYRLAREFVSKRRRPTGLFVANNLMTIGAMLALKEDGVRIPEELAVVGFDDMEWAPVLTPTLTAVAQPAYTLGTSAAQLLMQRLDNPSRPAQEVILKTHLVVRESCGAPLARRAAAHSGHPAGSARSL
jgi:LacI family transcriptional regulator